MHIDAPIPGMRSAVSPPAEKCDLLTASLTGNVDGYAYLVSDARPAEACG